MKKISIYSLLFMAIIFFSCNNNSNVIENQPTFQPSTSLEGNWLIQDIPSGAKLNFSSNNFTIISGTVTIKGTFTLINNTMSGRVVSRSGTNNEGLQPDTFTGTFEILNNQVTFTNFSGNWQAVFSTWYRKK